MSGTMSCILFGCCAVMTSELNLNGTTSVTSRLLGDLVHELDVCLSLNYKTGYSIGCGSYGLESSTRGLTSTCVTSALLTVDGSFDYKS